MHVVVGYERLAESGAHPGGAQVRGQPGKGRGGDLVVRPTAAR
ncbi:MAG: hypothetical protein ACRDOI_47165 [Trebonia sp.]